MHVRLMSITCNFPYTIEKDGITWIFGFFACRQNSNVAPTGPRSRATANQNTRALKSHALQRNTSSLPDGVRVQILVQFRCLSLNLARLIKIIRTSDLLPVSCFSLNASCIERLLDSWLLCFGGRGGGQGYLNCPLVQ